MSYIFHVHYTHAILTTQNYRLINKCFFFLFLYSHGAQECDDHWLFMLPTPMFWGSDAGTVSEHELGKAVLWRIPLTQQAQDCRWIFSEPGQPSGRRHVHLEASHHQGFACDSFAREKRKHTRYTVILGRDDLLGHNIQTLYKRWLQRIFKQLSLFLVSDFQGSKLSMCVKCLLTKRLI